MACPRRMVVFDLDGTLTRRDTYLAYLVGFLARHPWRFMRAWHLPWQVIKFAVGRINNTEIKQHFLLAVLGGVSRIELDRWTQMFLDRLMTHGLWNDGLDALNRHREHGDVLVLLSASFDFYVESVGHRLGFDQVVCTKAEWSGDHLTGNLGSVNRYGAEKLHCLKELKMQYGAASVVAYADHPSDFPMLRLADEGVLINGTLRAQALATQEGILCRMWRQ